VTDWLGDANRILRYFISKKGRLDRKLAWFSHNVVKKPDRAGPFLSRNNPGCLGLYVIIFHINHKENTKTEKKLISTEDVV